MMKRVFSTSLLTMLFFSFCIKASAYDVAVQNTSGTTIYYNYINDGTELEVTYGESMYRTYDGPVIIPSSVTLSGVTRKVTSIGDNAFNSCTDLTAVVIPDDVTRIGSYAFTYCQKLTDVIIPDYVTTIGNQAFYNCTELASVTIGRRVNSIGQLAFTYCTKLTKIIVKDIAAWCGISFADNPLFYARHLYSDKYTEITTLKIPDGVKSISDRAFQYCEGITSVVIPNSVTSIGETAFQMCTALTSVSIGDGVTSIGRAAFNGAAFTSLVIPNSVTDIGDGAFQGCKGLISLTIGSGVKSIGTNAFSACNALKKVIVKDIAAWCGISFADNPLFYAHHLYSDENTEITDLVIPDGVTTIEAIAFQSCSLTSVTIPNSVTSIGNSAFWYCSNLSTAVIGDGVTSIGNSAFISCTALTSVSIGNSVTSIGTCAFEKCNNLEKVIVKNMAAWCSIPFDDNESNPLYYAKHIYSDEDTEITDLVIPDEVTSIGTTFRFCEGFTSIVIGDGVTQIANYAFENSSKLTSLTVGRSVSSIGYDAFRYCNNLSKVIVKDIAAWCGISFVSNPLFNVKRIYSDENTEITDLVIPDGVASIASNAFNRCVGLTSVTIPNSVTSIGNSAFSGCSNLAAAVIGDGVTSIGKSAFSGCINLATAVIPDGVTSIGSSAFENCVALTSIVIPDGVTNISDGTFYRCSALTSVVIPDGVTDIDHGAFAGCSGLVSLTIGSGVKSIGTTAFNSCSGLEKVIVKDIAAWCGISFGGNPLSIAHHLYSDEDTEITDLVIPDGVESIANSAFEGCSGLTSVVIPDGVASIGEYAFYKCSGLTSAILPKSLTAIGNYAFYECASLTKVTCNAEVPPVCGAISFASKSNYKEYVLTVPESGYTRYKTEWRSFFNITDKINVTMGSAGMMTYCSGIDLSFTDATDLEAYVAAEYDEAEGAVLLTRVQEVPAGTGVLLIGNPGSREVSCRTTTASHDNLLKGTLVEQPLPTEDGEYSNYVLANKNGSLGFYKSSGGKIAANKAYLQLPTSRSHSYSMIRIGGDDYSTGINLLRQTNGQQPDAIYNLNGQRVKRPQQGVYIKGGKKMIIH